ncbi:hypothetical protein NBM05_12365 [Rothia sp. AR01]|uniref:Adhesin domain-containing protein n=1 Tax=Rothia santali TaxID=2949643 RepID=A0A9X2KJE9_9MICC|nr:hypothetical protein [Rothia santali]MCP3426774.1 hypothetical protein [Rothia santali]
MNTPDHENQQGRHAADDGRQAGDGYEYPATAPMPSPGDETGRGGAPWSGPDGSSGGPSGGSSGPSGGSGGPSGGPAGPRPAAAAPRRAGYGVVVGVLTAVVGGIVLATSAGSETLAAAGSISRADSTQSADAAGITDLDVDADGALLTVGFGDVDQAVLEVRNGARDGWRMQREGGELTVGKRDDWCLMWCHREQEQAVLTLPESLNDGSLNADLTLDAGELRADGRFADLETTVNAGALTVTGAARTLDADVSAGRADLELDGVAEGTFGVSAGRMTAELTGQAPTSVGLEVSAGSLDLTVPDAPYRVDVDRSAGSLDNRLDATGSPTSSITGELSAGNVTLRAGR